MLREADKSPRWVICFAWQEVTSSQGLPCVRSCLPLEILCVLVPRRISEVGAQVCARLG